MLCEGEKMLGEALRSGAKLKTVLVRARLGQSAHLRQAEEQGAALYSARRMRCSNSQVRWKRRRTSSFPAMQPQWDGGRRWMAAGAGAPAGRLAGPGQPCARSYAPPKRSRSAPLCCARAAPIRFHPRSSRSTMGAVFRLPCVHAPACGGRSNGCTRNGLPLYATALHEDSVPLSSRFALPKPPLSSAVRERA